MLVTNPIFNIGQRKRLHELPYGMHCMVIGTCFNLQEIRKLLRKCRTGVKKMTDYEVHTTAVNYAKENCNISKRLHVALDKKFLKDIRFYDELPEDQLLPAWKNTLSNGEIPGPFWALITHPSTSDALTLEVFADTHMLSHLMGASNRADLQNLNRLEQKLKELKENQNYWQKEAHARKIEVENAQNEITQHCEIIQQQEKQIASLKNQVVQLESNGEHQRLHERLHSTEKQLKKVQNERDYLENRLMEFEEDHETLKRHHESLKESLGMVKEENHLLEQMLHQNTVSSCISGEMENNCNLEETCILYVGGRSNLLSHYRSLVENYNGSFLYHDGGVEMKEKELDQMMGRSDVVVCPPDCVSHNAFLRIKKHCKKTKKCFLMLRSSGLSSLNYAIAAYQGKGLLDQDSNS